MSCESAVRRTRTVTAFVLDEALLRNIANSCGAEVRRGHSLRFLEASDMPSNYGRMAARPFSAEHGFPCHRQARCQSTSPQGLFRSRFYRIETAHEAGTGAAGSARVAMWKYCSCAPVMQVCKWSSKEQRTCACSSAARNSWLPGGTLQSLLADLQHNEPHLALRMDGHLPLSLIGRSRSPACLTDSCMFRTATIRRTCSGSAIRSA